MKFILVGIEQSDTNLGRTPATKTVIEHRLINLDHVALISPGKDDSATFFFSLDSLSP